MKRLLVIFAVVGCGQKDEGGRAVAEPELAGVAKLVVTSSAFAPNGELPIDHTCEGADVAPPLAWSGAPPTTRSFAIIVDDPDAPDPAAPKRVWVHWVLIDLPATTTSLPIGAGSNPPAGTAKGKNDFGKLGWNGPCPPIGRHRYFFKVYALDRTIDAAGITKPALLAAMQRHIVAMGQVVGTYQKRPKP